MTKGEIAKNYYINGLNCAQAVVMAFEKELDIPADKLKKLIAGFGGGFGRQGLVCGAVSGMTMVLGYLMPDGAEKVQVYKEVKSACDKVIEKTGALNCAELKKMNKMPCGDICQIVADITQEFISK